MNDQAKDKSRVCVISPEIVGPHKNGGVGTHSYYLSLFLSRELGHEVTFLYTGEIELHDEAHWREAFRRDCGIEFVWIPPTPTEARSGTGEATGYTRTSSLVYEWLRERKFDVCHFQEMLGNGCRSFQAKRLGVAFAETVLTCTVHSSWDWINQAMQAFPHHGRREVEAKWMERYSIEHCDVLLSPSQYMLDWVAANRIPVRAGQQVVPLLFNPDMKPVGSQPVDRHLIFFGRLEVRKGILIFLDALRKLAAAPDGLRGPIRVTFLGKPGYTPDGDGARSIELARAEVAGIFTLQAVTDFGHRQAMEFLSANNDALVVCPSLVDNSPYAIIECIQLGLNIVAGRCGGIPELFDGTDRLFDPTADALAAMLRAGLANRLPPLAKRYGSERSRELWRALSVQTIPALRRAAPARAEFPARPVHVLVVAGAAHADLDASLASLAAQDWRGFSATIAWADEGGAGADAARCCAERGWKMIAGDAAAIPAGGADELLVVLRAGALLEAGAVRRLERCMEHSGADALACRGRVSGCAASPDLQPFEPLGACCEGGIFFNAFGEGVFIVRAGLVALDAARLRSLRNREGLWSCLAGLAAEGAKVDVVPEVLVTFEAKTSARGWEDLDYTAHMAVLDAMGGKLPNWLRYTLLNAVAAERANRAMQLEVCHLRNKSRRTLAAKVSREAGRVWSKMRRFLGGGQDRARGSSRKRADTLAVPKLSIFERLKRAFRRRLGLPVS